MCPKSRTSVLVPTNRLTWVTSSETFTVYTNLRRPACRTHELTVATVGHE